MSRDMTQQTLPVIVVGGGLAGLTAAALLARQGQRVRLYEKAGHLGGRADTQTRSEFQFNQGPHALYLGGPAERIFGELGVKFTGGKPKSAGSAIVGGKVYDLPATVTTLLTSPLLNLKAKWEIIGLLSRAKKLDPAEGAGLTLQQWLELNIKQPQARQMLVALARVATYTNAPDIQSAETFLRQLQMTVANGVFYIDGGWQTLINGLTEVARQANVEIITSKRVERVDSQPQTGARGVWLNDGQFEPAKAIILASGDPKSVAQLVDQPQVAAWVKDARSIQAACLDVALDHLPEPNRKFALGFDQPLYYSVHSTYAKLGPAGKTMLHAAIYLAPNDSRDAHTNRQTLEEMLDRLQPGWRGVVLDERFLPEMTVCHEWPVATPKMDGSVPGVANLYVVGDWIKTGGWLTDAALGSAEQVVKTILKEAGATQSASDLSMAS